MKNPLSLPILNPHAAGIDVGSEKIFASIGGKEPKVFLTVTAQMKELCAHFKAERTSTVAMEATGVYWINLDGVSEEAGLEVVVGNGASSFTLGTPVQVTDIVWNCAQLRGSFEKHQLGSFVIVPVD